MSGRRAKGLRAEARVLRRCGLHRPERVIYRALKRAHRKVV